MSEKKVGAVLVLADDVSNGQIQIAGMFTERDVLRRKAAIRPAHRSPMR